MAYVAIVGLLFVPLVCLLCAAWFFVRWQNEHDNTERAAKDKKISRGFLLAAVVALVIFGVLKIVFPFA